MKNQSNMLRPARTWRLVTLTLTTAGATRSAAVTIAVLRDASRSLDAWTRAGGEVGSWSSASIAEESSRG
jgi:hypothetical protein